MNFAGDLGATLCEVTVAAVLVASGASKLVNTTEFGNTLVALGMPARRERLIAIAAATISLAELAIGFFTVARVQPRLASLALLVAAGLFTTVTAWATARRPKVRCRCFGSLTESQFGRRGLAVNLALVAMAIIAMLYEWAYVPAISMSVLTRTLVILAFGIAAIAVGQAALVLPALSQPTEVAQ
jgi:hypothetical protein